MAGGPTRWPYKSTGATRSLLLRALGVVKVATAAQLRQLVLPGTADEQTVRNGCKDLREAGLVESVGRTYRPGRGGVEVAQDLWNLTPAGLAAAAAELERPVKEMGGTAREAAKAGAAHALAVTDVIDAIRQTPPRPTKPIARRATATPAPRRELPVRPRGLGNLSSWTTEVALPATGTFTTPAKGSLRADGVMTAPDDVPLLFVEVDTHTETTATVAAKIAAYRTFARRKTGADSRAVPLWSTLWHAPDLLSHPPVAIVFTKPVSAPVLDRRIAAIREASREHWAAPWTNYDGFRVGARPREEDGWREYKDVVPVITTTLALLREHGPHGPVWTRFGRTRPEPITLPLTYRNTQDDYLARSAERRATAEHRRPAPAEAVPRAVEPAPAAERAWEGRPAQTAQPAPAPWPTEWPCPSCTTSTDRSASGLDDYTPAPGGRCPRCEQTHRELVAERQTRTGILSRLRAHVASD